MAFGWLALLGEAGGNASKFLGRSDFFTPVLREKRRSLWVFLVDHAQKQKLPLLRVVGASRALEALRFPFRGVPTPRLVRGAQRSDIFCTIIIPPIFERPLMPLIDRPPLASPTASGL